MKKKIIIRTGIAGMRIFLLIMTALMISVTVIGFPHLKNDIFVIVALIILSVFFAIGCFAMFNSRVVLDEELEVVKLYFIRTRTISILDIKEIKVWEVPHESRVYNSYYYIVAYLKTGGARKIPLYGTKVWAEYIDDEMKRLNKRIQELKKKKQHEKE